MRGITASNRTGGSERPRFVVRCVLLVCLFVAGQQAMGAAPTLERIFPPGGQRGSQVVATCFGKFTWPVRTWAPGVDVRVLDDGGKLEIKIPKNFPSDQTWIRLYNDEGSSAVVPFLIGNLPEAEEMEPNNAPESAQAVGTTGVSGATGVTVNGTLQENGDVDAYAVDLAAGQTLVASVEAHVRLGSPMDAMLQVTTADGTVLAANHDANGLDPRIVLTAAQSGVHIIRLFAFPAEPDTNISYRGASTYVYRLTLTSGPFITHSLPLTVSLSDPGSVQALGWNLPCDARLPVMTFANTPLDGLLEDEAAHDVRVCPDARVGSVFGAGMAGAARVRLVPHTVAREVASPSDQMGSLEVPGAVTGHLKAPGECHEYQLKLFNGMSIVLAAEAASLQLPTVPEVQLMDPSGKIVAESPRRGSIQDAVLTHTAASDGDFRLVVRDRFRHGGDRYYYRLSVHSDQSNMKLMASADSIVVVPGSPAVLPVTVQRHSAPHEPLGAIKIEAIDLPPGVLSDTVVSEVEGETSGRVSITLNATGPAYSGPIRIRATSDHPRLITRFARAPSKYPAYIAAIWLTVIAAESPQELEQQ